MQLGCDNLVIQTQEFNTTSIVVDKYILNYMTVSFLVETSFKLHSHLH